MKLQQIAVVPFAPGGDYAGHYVYAIDINGYLWRAHVVTWARGSRTFERPEWKHVNWSADIRESLTKEDA